MSVLYPLIQALVLFAVAPLLSGITRVARARLHNRRGPGVLQEYRDIIKLLGRQSVGPDASGWVFRLTPYVMVGVMLTIATALPVVTVGSPLPQLGDLITLLYLFAIARFFFAISGLDTGSPFTAIGASREAMLGVLVEPMLLLGSGHCFRDQVLDFCADYARSEGKRTVEGTSLQTIIYMAAQGLGVTVLPASAAPYYRSSEFIKILPFEKPAVPKRRVALVWRKSFPRTAAIEAITHAVDKISLEGTRALTALPAVPA